MNISYDGTRDQDNARIENITSIVTSFATLYLLVICNGRTKKGYLQNLCQLETWNLSRSFSACPSFCFLLQRQRNCREMQTMHRNLISTQGPAGVFYFDVFHPKFVVFILHKILKSIPSLPGI
jgi:hypothetical protein